MKIIRIVPISVSLILLIFTNLYPWVKVGHQTIGCIAQMNLAPATLEKMKPLLEGGSLADISTWADDVKRDNRVTKTWHYINLPVREDITEKDLPRFFGTDDSTKDNIISQVKKDIAALKDSGGPLDERREALKFLVHFIEDAHQPLHCADDGDRRGNFKQVKFIPPDSRKGRGKSIDLHLLWNSLLEVKAREEPGELAKRINGKCNAAQKQKWAGGSIEDWVYESYTIAKSKIYPGFPPGPVSEYTLPKNYYDEMRPIVEEQLEKAGIRLAMVLEDVFGK
jgi:hypothetical protein